MSGLGYWQKKRQWFIDQAQLKNNRTFIVPTAFGWVFALMSFVMLVLAIGYLNNLLYFFVFMLISMALSGMLTTNKNIEAVSVRSIRAGDLFANEEGSLLITFENKKKNFRLYQIEFSYLEGHQVHQPFCIVSEMDQSFTQALPFKPTKRGYYQAPRLIIRGTYPFQMLRAWKYFQPTFSFYVYPQKKGVAQFPQTQGRDALENEKLAAESEGLFKDLREFQKTDSPHRIDWRRSLKHQKILVKNYEQPTDQQIQLSWEQTAFLNDFEEKVSQLALWIDMACKQNLKFSLKINSEVTVSAQSRDHYLLCLRKLALLQPQDIL